MRPVPSRSRKRARVIEPALLALLDHEALGLLVGRGAEREAVAETHEPPFALQEGRQLAVVDGDRREARCGELRLERLGRARALAEARHRARKVEARAPPLDAGEREHVLGPWLCGNRDPGVERVGGLDPRPQGGTQLLEPFGGEDPLAGVLEAVRLAAEVRSARPL